MLNAVWQILSVSLGSQCLGFSFSATRVFVVSVFVNAYWQPKLAIWFPETILLSRKHHDWLARLVVPGLCPPSLDTSSPESHGDFREHFMHIYCWSVL